MEDGCVGGKDRPKTVDAPIASAFGPDQDDAHEPEASSVPAVSPATRLSQRYRNNISRGSHDLITNSS
jgi:hypothetical protein